MHLWIKQNLKKVILCLVLVLSAPNFAVAASNNNPPTFLYEVKILSKDELKKLNNQELLDLYTSTLIERQASQTFHGKAGFTPREYSQFKELLGLVVRIRQEMVAREMDAPPVDQWLR